MNNVNMPRSSITEKLLKILRLMAIVTLLVATASLFWREYVGLQQTLVNKLALTANMIGQNSSVALLFDDRQTAQEVLNALTHDPDILDGLIETEHAGTFAKHHKANTAWHQFWLFDLPKTIKVSQPIIHGDGRVLGRISLVASLQRNYHALLHNALANALIVFIALSLATLFVVRLQRSLLRPILQLANTAREIELNHDYTKRSNYQGNDEISDLAEAFDGMLIQIQRNEANLEQQVLLRTAELEQARLEAVNANETKSQFLANMSHEIRTPMNAVLGLLELCLNSELTDKQRQYLSRAVSVAIVNDHHQ